MPSWLIGEHLFILERNGTFVRSFNAHISSSSDRILIPFGRIYVISCVVANSIIAEYVIPYRIPTYTALSVYYNFLPKER